MVTLIREDLGLDPGLVVGPSLNLVGLDFSLEAV